MRAGLLIIDEDARTALEVARAADAAGIDSIWTIDYYNRGSLARAAAFAAATSTVRIGTSVTPIFARAALATAAAAIDIQAASNNRFILGAGSSTRRMNRDWYDVELDHPAPRAEERIRLIRALMEHTGGPFRFDGTYDHVNLAHYDRQPLGLDPVPIYAAGVGPYMVRAAGRVADGFVGHPIASADVLRDTAKPALAEAAAAAGRGEAPFTSVSQIIAVASDDAGQARRHAAQQVGFYSTVKGYDALFPGDEFATERIAARSAFASGDVAGVARAADPFVGTRAVFGAVDEVAAQLERYADAIDVALLYPPHYGVEPAVVTANEYRLIEVARLFR